MTVCPNCGSVEFHSWATTKWVRCHDCGTMEHEETKMCCVPTRSRPPEPAAISDADVMKFLVGCYHMAGTSSHIPGPRPTNEDVERLWAKVSQPPIDPPAKVEPDDDATWLRNRGMYLEDCTRFCRIADDLERLRREAKEAGR